MTNKYLTPLFFVIGVVSTSSFASLRDSESPMKTADKNVFSEDITGVNLTGYSAKCKSDPWGGRNESAWGDLRPRSHTLDGKPEMDTVEVAVPQSKGTASLFGCYIELDFTHSNVPMNVRKLFSGKRIFAADHYDVGSNGHRKFDISLECTSRGNINNFNYTGVVVRKIRCLGTSVTAQAKGLLGNEIQTASNDNDEIVPR